MNDLEKTVNLIREGLEDYCADHDGDMYDYFGEGSIYGEDLDGNFLVGFGVCGSANIVITKDCVECGKYKSKEFSQKLKDGLAEFRNLLENC